MAGKKAQALQRFRLRRLSQQLGHMLVIVDLNHQRRPPNRCEHAYLGNSALKSDVNVLWTKLLQTSISNFLLSRGKYCQFAEETKIR